MGVWDATSFGNDTANDWAYTLEECDGLAYIESTLQTVVDIGDNYLGSNEAVEAIAAAEVLAWLRGRPTPVDSYTKKIATWVAAHPVRPPAAIIQKALKVLDRIQQEPSALAELWSDDTNWANAMNDLRTRLAN